VANAREERMDADYDCYGNKGEQADRYEKDPGYSQHRGHSVSAVRALRNITGGGYGGAHELP
jgi:hypothetical protein